MITFNHISKKFKYHFWDKEYLALDDISFHIKEGDLVGFLGANGAGKTTLIKILMDFSRQDSGDVNFSKSLGHDLLTIKSSIGYLPERAYLYPHLTGREFLQFMGEISEIDNSKIKNSIEYWAEKMQLSYAIDRRIKSYSKGMQQRLGFISALMHSPKFLVLDEPLSGLDPIGRREFKKILKQLNTEGVTIFFSSHIVSDVEEICNKVVFIEKGKLIYEGSIDHLLLEHSNDLYQFKYVLNDQLIISHVRENEKNQELERLISLKANILEVEKEKPNLEEIIYKIKK